MFTKWLKIINITPMANNNNNNSSTSSIQSVPATATAIPAVAINPTSVTAPCTPSSGQDRHSAMRNFMSRADSANSDYTLLSKTSVPASPTIAPFRKKAITSIERTRKLSILLKHQRTLVSFFFLDFFFHQQNVIKSISVKLFDRFCWTIKQFCLFFLCDDIN